MSRDARIDWRNAKQDSRPQRGAWAPGDYFCECRRCREPFIGDKRAIVCADCAYSDPEAAALLKRVEGEQP